jgi:hypothetical protein
MTSRWLSAPLLLLHTVLIGCTVSCGTEARVQAQNPPAEPHFDAASINRHQAAIVLRRAGILIHQDAEEA